MHTELKLEKRYMYVAKSFHALYLLRAQYPSGQNNVSRVHTA